MSLVEKDNSVPKETMPQTRQVSRVEVFLERVLRPEDRQAIKAALPSHISFARFERNLSNALMNEPRLLECNPREVFREVAKIASLGLLIDSHLGEAYLIASRTGPQARIGYRGLIKLARQTGEISLVYAHEVYENDEIDCRLGDDKKLTHKPHLFGDRGAIIGYYAVIKYKDGSTDFEPMTLGQIAAIRDRSDGYRAWKAQKIKDTPWASSYDEMAKKTCIRRLIKRCPQSPELAKAISLEEDEYIDAGHGNSMSLDNIRPSDNGRKSSITDRLDRLAANERIQDAGEESVDVLPPHNQQTGEIESGATTTPAAETDVWPDEPISGKYSSDEHLLKALLDARNKAREGGRKLTLWLSKLGQHEYIRLQGHMSELREIATKADEARQ